MAWPTSARFRDAIGGTHRAVARVRLLSTIQFGASPVGGIELPLLDANVRRNATSDVKATLAATVPGDYFDDLAPYGVELFAERGVDFGDGTREYVPLGYFRVEQLDQSSMPYGPIRVDASDRVAQLIQSRVIYPYQVPAGTSHRAVFNTLVNGTESGAGTYGMYVGVTVPVDWTAAGYDPDAELVPTDVLVDDSVYDFLAKLVDAKGATITAKRTGELAVVNRNPAIDTAPDIVLREGRTGTLTQASRRISRDDVVNIVRATGSDPATQTGYRLAYITDPLSPLRWTGPFGPAVRYYASPLLTTSDAADAAAETILARATGLPVEQGLWIVPDPSIDPLDVARVEVATLAPGTHTLDELTVPLTGGGAVELRTRTLNPVPQNPTDPEPTPTPDPEPDPEEPGPPPVGGGDPSDGVQAARVRNWGSIIFGDEFTYTGRPDPAKWGLYDGVGHGGNGRRSPDAFDVRNGMMTITGKSNGTSGGTACKHRTGRGYRCEIRARVYNTANNGSERYHPVLILWPDNNQWPEGAEYDFMECDEGSGEFGLFMHLPNHSPYRQDHESFDLDIQNWHNYACEWNPSARTLKAFVDGEQIYSGSGRVADAPGPMHLTIQLDNFGNTNRDAKFDIAWVRIYERPNA
jgi:hypothetical protein